MSISFNRILLPTDFSGSSRAGMDMAIALGRKFNSEIQFISVKEHHPLLFGNPIEDNLSNELQENITGWIASKQAEGYNNLHFTSLEGDRVHKSILQFAESFKPDIIIMGTHGIKGMEEYLLGSNAARVVRGARCAVLTVQEAWTSRTIKNIVMPIDNSVETRQKADEAAAVAIAFDARVRIVGINENHDEFMLNSVNGYMHQVSEYFTSMNVAHTSELRTGKNNAQLVIDYSEEVGGDVIVIMTEQESNILGSFLGTYATRLVNHSKIPVLSVGPKKDMQLFAGTVFSDWSV